MDYIRLSVTLMLIAGIAAGILSKTNDLTRPVIAKNAAIEEKAALREILPEADSFVAKSFKASEALLFFIKDKALAPETDKENNLKFKIALKNKKPFGMAFKLRPAGFSGAITMMVGIKESTTANSGSAPVVAGIKIIDHTETPGLGANVNEIKKELFEKISSEKDFSAMKNLVTTDSLAPSKKPWFQSQFLGLCKDQLLVDKDKGPVHSITAATISSRAVTNALSKAMDLYMELKTNSEVLK